MIRTSIAIVAAASMLIAAGFRNAPVAEVGQPAPNFTVKASSGKAVSLDQYKGKYVVLEWWNEGCPFVKKHYNSGNMQASQKWAKDQGVIWLTVVSSAEGKQGYVTAEEANARYKERNMASEAILLDPEGSLGHLYGAKTTPHMFVISPKGVLIYNGAIDDKPTTDLADVKTAKNYVKAAIEESKAGKEVSTPTSRPYGCSMKYKD
jgi:peroxiredoxin